MINVNFFYSPVSRNFMAEFQLAYACWRLIKNIKQNNYETIGPFFTVGQVEGTTLHKLGILTFESDGKKVTLTPKGYTNEDARHIWYNLVECGCILDTSYDVKDRTSWFYVNPVIREELKPIE